MTEPVAYMIKTAGGNVFSFRGHNNSNKHLKNATPLYTSEQLHPRVKMTQAEFDELNSLNEQFTILGVLSYVQEYRDTKTVNLYLWRQIELAKLWDNYDRDRPEETIEIVPDMKWFVEKKKFNGDYKFLKINEKDLRYNHLKEQATQFDTKEEAELWTNPLTKSVQLPEEGE